MSTWSNRTDVAVVEKEVRWCRKDQVKLRKSLCGDLESGVKVLAALGQAGGTLMRIWRGFNLRPTTREGFAMSRRVWDSTKI